MLNFCFTKEIEEQYFEHSDKMNLNLYDKFPDIIKQKLKESKYNICCACVLTKCYSLNINEKHKNFVQTLLEIINQFELEVLSNENT